METYPDITKNPTIEAMFKAGAHFGYSKSRRHPSVKGFIFGAKNRTEIIDLAQVQTLLEKAEAVFEKLGSEGKQIIFVGNKPEAKEAVLKGALEIAMPYSRERWIGGTFTNFVEIKKRVARLEDLDQKKLRGELSIYPKKEIIKMEKELEGLKRFFAGIISMRSLPAAIFIVDPKKEVTAVSEARKLRIPIIALAGSDSDITNIDFPIVANDASVLSIRFFVDSLVSAYKRGKANPVVIKESTPTNETNHVNNDNDGAH